MSLKCVLGFHQWDGCTCTICGKIRNEQHILNEDCEKCSKCGSVIPNQHNWSTDCQKCSKCGKTRDVEHHWIKNCEKCSKCGKTRTDQHHMVDGICQVCGNGIFTDETNGLGYKIVKIGTQIIMAENFARIPASGHYWAYDGEKKNVVKNGYLYDWETARSIVPKGWHLPSKEEWESLMKFLGGKDKEVYEQMKPGGESGFEGLFSGWRFVRGAFNSLGASGYYWTATEESDKKAWFVKMSAYKNRVEIDKGDKGLGLSVRLFRD